VSRNESVQTLVVCCVINDGLPRCKRFLGGAYKLPTGAMVKSYGTERVGKGLQG